MIPDDRLSSESAPSDFLYPASKLPLAPSCQGPLAVGDASQGLRVQRWVAHYNFISGDLQLVPTQGAPFTVFTRTGVSELSFDFNQNGQPTVAFVQGGQAKFFFFNTAISDYDVWETELGSAKNPRVCLDDARIEAAQWSDLILAYLTASNGLRYRQQRDLFSVEYDPTEPLDEPERTDYRNDIASKSELIRVGMSSTGRLQFLLR